MRIPVLLCCIALAFPTMAAAHDVEEHWEAGGLFTYVFLERIGSSDYRVGTAAAGLGGRIVYRIFDHLDAEGEVLLHPNVGVQGRRVQVFAGVKAGHRFSKIGLFAKARPGFIYFSRDPFGVFEPGATPFVPKWASSTDASMDIGGVLEYYTLRGAIVRFDLGNTIVQYEPRMVLTSQFVSPVAAGGFTTRNRQWSLGLGFRF